MQNPDEPHAAASPRHSAVVRVTHWLTVIAFVALLITGIEIVISHPRFYWGEVGTVMTKPLFTLPIPASRDTVPTGYNYIMPDGNGWGRSLHFQAAWLVLFTGAVYFVASLWSGHLRRDLLPQRGQRSLAAFAQVIRQHLHLSQGVDDAGSYNVLQRTTYLGVIFVLFPMMIWTGLAMSPAFTAAVPWSVELLGGKQTARTLHFFVTNLLVLFVVVHGVMVTTAGFRIRMRAMITGRTSSPTTPATSIAEKHR
jgi:thiosulfate reductase cytochrome b subunit